MKHEQMNESCVETGSGKQDVPVSRITTGAGKQAWSIFGVVLSTALIGWLDFLSGWEFSFFPLYAIPIWLAIWVSGLGFGILVALACGVAWWWANEEVHPYTTPWGYPMAAVARWIYFAAVVIAGTAVRRRQIVDAIAIQRLAKLKAKEAELNAVCEHELRFVGRSICGVLRGQMSGLIESLRRLASSKADFRDNELTNQALSNAENLSLELQAIADGIFPPADVSGPNVLYASLKSLVEYKSRTSGIRIELTRESEHVSVNNPLVCMHLYRIAQEALDNVIRHSKAANAWISLQAFYDHLELRVDDDGCGISDAGVPASESGMGVKIMRYRAGALNAYFSLQGRPGGGTSVACRLPCFDSMTRSA